MQSARFVPLLAALGSGACGLHVEGALYIDTGSYRTIEYVPRDCADGDHFGFFGVQLRDDEGRILDFFRKGRAPGVAFYTPHGVGGEAFELGPADCEVLAGSLTRQHNRTTGVGRVEGDLDLDCEAPNGWTLQGTLAFERCADLESDEDEEDVQDDDDDDEDVWYPDDL